MVVNFIYFSFYFAVACFVVGCAWRTWRIARLPMHLRWELYPVPHEEPRRADYGGSYFEDSEWWTKPRKFNLLGEVKATTEEIFLFRSVWTSNRPLWWRSFAFHFGMYCVVSSIAVQLLLLSFSLDSGWLLAAVGRMGLALVCAGAISLFWRRVFDRELRDYTHRMDIVQLGALVSSSALMLVGSLHAKAPALAAIISGALRWNSELQIPAVLGAGLLLASALVAYIPFSPMSHFIAKYFTYHNIRWDDRSNTKGTRFSKDAGQLLGMKPTWSAAHMGCDGARSWGEVAGHNPAQATEVRR